MPKLKVGDRIYQYHRANNPNDIITIKRLTRTQATGWSLQANYSVKFKINHDDGLVVALGKRISVDPVRYRLESDKTKLDYENAVLANKKRELLWEVKSVDFDALSFEQLEQILRICEVSDE